MAPAIRLGTRGSALAVAQATAVARDLEALGADVELVKVATSGDEQPTAGHRPFEDSAAGTAAIGPGPPARKAAGAAAVEDKARFVKELEQALLAGEIDLAVHSAKDVPGELPAGLEIVAVPERADPRDALCLAPRLGSISNGSVASGSAPRESGDAVLSDAVPSDRASHVSAGAPGRHSLAARPLDALPDGATVGTASLRRRAELLALRPDLEIRELRGNVDTRLRRLAEGGPPELDGKAQGGAALSVKAIDAIVLAAAGLARLGRSDEGIPLPELTLIPAAGQGCLALEARADDADTRRLASRLTDPRAFACLTAERTLVTAIGATCHTPVGAHATIVNHSILHLEAFVGTPDGKTWIRDDVRGLAEDPRAVGLDAANRLDAAGAPAILAAAETPTSNQ